MTQRLDKAVIIFIMTILALNSVFVGQMIISQTNGNSVPTENTDLSSAASEEDTSSIPYITADAIPNLSAWNLTINATRIIKLLDFGTLLLNDSFSIINNDNVSLPYFRFAMPNDWAKNMQAIYGYTMWANRSIPFNHSRVLSEAQDDQFTYYKLDLNPILDNSSRYIVNIQSYYFDAYKIFEHVSTGEWNLPGTENADQGNLYNGIRFNFSKIPFITKPIQKCITKASVVDDGAVISQYIHPSSATYTESTITYSTEYNVSSLNASKEYIRNDPDDPYRVQASLFLRVKPPAMITEYKRTITLDSWYFARVHEEITIKNLGVKPEDPQYNLMDPRVFTCCIFNFYLTVADSQDVSVKDFFGDLDPSSSDRELFTKKRINVYLRVPLFGGDSASVEVDYLLQLDHILSFEKSEFILNTEGVPISGLIVKDFELNIVLPQGGHYQYMYLGNEVITTTQSSTKGVVLSLGKRDKITLQLNNHSSYQSSRIRLGYYMSDFAYFVKPMLFSIIIFIACLCYIGVRTLRKDIVEEVIITRDDEKEAPVELIRDFVEKYEEKTALQKRITELNEKRRRRKIKAKEFDKQRRILESKTRQLIEELSQVKRILKAKGRKYDRAIQRIEVNEETRVIIEQNIKNLRVRYIREKQISKDAYLRILQDYQSQIERLERNIDKEIINLRLIIEHEQKEA
ncbi:hypothetical protein EU523_00120 [Candidatus Heimdallarchaeota archaeon]|nr:MAG: hypothetical protein EU523_00120 [Candidatus Heimdallarchaeota archaeon]